MYKWWFDTTTKTVKYYHLQSTNNFTTTCLFSIIYHILGTNEQGINARSKAISQLAEHLDNPIVAGLIQAEIKAAFIGSDQLLANICYADRGFLGSSELQIIIRYKKILNSTTFNAINPYEYNLNQLAQQKIPRYVKYVIANNYFRPKITSAASIGAMRALAYINNQINFMLFTNEINSITDELTLLCQHQSKPNNNFCLLYLYNSLNSYHYSNDFIVNLFQEVSLENSSEPLDHLSEDLPIPTPYLPLTNVQESSKATLRTNQQDIKLQTRILLGIMCYFLKGKRAQIHLQQIITFIIINPSIQPYFPAHIGRNLKKALSKIIRDPQGLFTQTILTDASQTVNIVSLNSIDPSYDNSNKLLEQIIKLEQSIKQVRIKLIVSVIITIMQRTNSNTTKISNLFNSIIILISSIEARGSRLLMGDLIRAIEKLAWFTITPRDQFLEQDRIITLVKQPPADDVEHELEKLANLFATLNANINSLIIQLEHSILIEECEQFLSKQQPTSTQNSNGDLDKVLLLSKFKESTLQKNYFIINQLPPDDVILQVLNSELEQKYLIDTSKEAQDISVVAAGITHERNHRLLLT